LAIALGPDAQPELFILRLVLEYATELEAVLLFRLSMLDSRLEPIFTQSGFKPFRADNSA